MAYTATLDRLELENGKWSVNITYTDGIDTVREGYTLTSVSKQSLRDLARRDALRLFNAPTTDVDIPIGTTIDVTPDPVTPPPDPTPAEIARAAWFVDYRQLQSMLRATDAVPALLNTQAQTAIDNLRTSLESGWLNSYLDGI